MAAPETPFHPRSTVKRYLPPLVILLIVAAIVVQILRRPGCDAQQERIRGMLADRSRGAETMAEIDRYRDSCSGTDHRWFSTEATLRVGRWKLALDRAFGEGGHGNTPGGTSRFGRIGLEMLGWRDAEHELPEVVGEVPSLAALVEAGEPWAREMLLERAQTSPLEGTRQLLFHCSRFATAPPLRLVVQGFRENTVARGMEREAMLLAAAFTAMGKAPYPEREADMERLLDAVKGLGSMRTGNLDAWAACTLALGRSEDPRATAALTKVAKRLEGSIQKGDKQVLDLVRCALLASGDWEQFKALKPVVQDQRPHDFLLAWYLEALLHRFAEGDDEARFPLGEVWLELGPEDDLIRLRIAFALLLPEQVPAMDTVQQRGPILKMVQDLLLMKNTPLGRVLGLAFLLRVGEPEARGRLIDVLGQIAEAWELDPSGRDPEMRPAWIAGMRALTLYGETPAKAN